MAPLVILIALLSFSPALSQNNGKLSSVSDLAGLYSLRASLGLRAQDWPRKTDPCGSWTGVTCRSGRVVSLNLSGLRRTRLGKLDPQFSVDGLRNLTQLESFNSTGFSLPGPIPAWFGTGGLAPTFQSLDLSSSSLSGEIPATLSGIQNLTTLILASNNVSGTLPGSLWLLPSLRILDVSGNNLTGALPAVAPVFGANASGDVTRLDLSGNNFYGTVPAGFRNLFGRLDSIDVSKNYYDGEFPVANGGGKDVSYQLNCFVDAPNQRGPVQCQEFYAARGLHYDGPVSPPPPASHHKSNKKLMYILIGAIGGALLVLLFVGIGVAFCCLCRGRGKVEQRESATTGAESGVSGGGGGGEGGGGSSIVSGGGGGLQPLGASVNLARVGDSFTYEQLVNATSGFGQETLIKHGHSGDLYHGVLDNGNFVVVKRIDARVARKDGHMAELGLFAKGLHERLVPFLGHCLEKEDEKLLVYRLVPNGDLSIALHRKSGEEEEGMQSLDWIKRLKIATGMAEALCYLHHDCAPPMVHRDVQASSILLDDKFEVRLGSLSEVCAQEGEGHQNVITKLLRFSSSSEQGTSGSPAATCSYDVYCFGKVLLELVTGKLGISGSNDAATNEWLERTMPYVNIYEKELVSKIIDPSLIIDEDHLEEVWAMAIVAKSCLNPKPSKRPPMKYILRALENPLKVVREDHSSSSARLRATSSRGSWNASFLGSWRHSSSDIRPSRDDNTLKRSETIKSGGSNGGGSNGGELSFSRRRHSKDIFPEPSGVRDIED